MFLDNVLDFHIIQLAGLGNEEVIQAGTAISTIAWTAHLRQAQSQAVAADAHMGLATAVGTTSATEASSNDYHPRDKKTIGLRASRSALEKTYGLPARLPVWNLTNSGVNQSGSTITVSLQYPSGVTMPTVNTALPGFQVKVGDTVRYATSSRVSAVNTTSRRVTVEVVGTGTITELRFQFHGNPKISYRTPTYNDALLPFCIEKQGSNWQLCNLSNL